MAIKPAKPQHVVAIPYPAQGHITPMLQLCEQLVPHGFTFTFINSHHIHHRLQLAGSIRPPHDACHSEVDGTHHVQHAHVHTPHLDNTIHNEGVQVSRDAHQNEDDHPIHKPHHVQDADANDASGCKDTHVHAHDSDNTRAHEVHHYKGCSSIRMVYVAGGCAPEKLAHVSTAVEALRAAQGMCEPVEHLLSHIMEEEAVSFIMSDILLGWSSATAHKFGLPWVSFWPASAASLSAFIYFSDLVDQGEASLPIAEEDGEDAPHIEGIPGLPPTRLCDVPKIWDDKGKIYDTICKFFTAVEQASCVILNTFTELEGQVVEALSKRFPVHAVGPLLPSRYMQLPTCHDSAKQEGRPSLFPEDSSCLAWLDTQAPSSVLFISFGSISLRSHEQLQELAKGVHASGCPFLWVCKPDFENGSDNNGPNGFFTHEDGHPRGLIVPWAPQLQVLSHPSIGGFITHCGWNSVIESVSMGVPMLCWADTGERMSNQRFAVEFWQCGIDMVADMRRAKQHIDEAMLVGRDEVEKSIRFLMFEEDGASTRLRSVKLRDAAIKAYQDSHAQLNKFSQTMKQRCPHLVDSSR